MSPEFAKIDQLYATFLLTLNSYKNLIPLEHPGTILKEEFMDLRGSLTVPTLSKRVENWRQAINLSGNSRMRCEIVFLDKAVKKQYVLSILSINNL